MRHLLWPLLVIMAVAVPSHAAKQNPESGESCGGADCEGFDPGAHGGSSGGNSGGGSTFAESHGAYRVPFENGTNVYVAQDVKSHSPPGKLDLIGGGVGGVVNPFDRHRVVAASAGTIMKIEDSRKDSQSPTADHCFNNFVWIRHDNGEWTKYTHMKQHSVRVKAGLREGARVNGNTYLGDMGSVGCSNPPHLHFEVRVPPSPSPTINAEDGGIAGELRNPVMCGLKDGDRTFQRGKTYEAVDGPGEVRSGEDEVLRYGMPYHNYSCFLRRASDAGYQPVWIDFFNVGKDLYVNAVMRPKLNAWQARSQMDGDGFSSQNTALKAQGYRLTQLESYLDGKDVRYAALWEKASLPPTQVYRGYSAAEHQRQVDSLKARGYRPRSVSVVSTRSGEQYTAVWEQAGGGWSLRSAMSPAEYTALAAENHAKGLEVVYLNAYVKDDRPYLSAVWRSGVAGKVTRRTGVGGNDFGKARNDNRSLGLLTVALTAYEVDGVAKYAAVFGQ
jgi:hypothetical protein